MDSPNSLLSPEPGESRDADTGMERLVSVVQELSLARSLEAVTAIVRRAARALTGADGATFVFRDGDCCFYADEDAIGPLWKGQRFPLSACISGWSMIHRQSVVLEDIYADPRIPHSAYRPTFVKSLVMVPIRSASPIGAIGTYWAHRHRASAQQVKLLQALADSSSIAIENVQLYQSLEQRVQERTRQLDLANRELEAFSYSVSHDLRAPLRHMNGFAEALAEDYAPKLDETGLGYLRRISHAAKHMGELIESMLELSKVSRAPLRHARVDLTARCESIVAGLRASAPDRHALTVDIAPGLEAHGDAALLDILLTNLLGNAWKFTQKRRDGTERIEVGRVADAREPTFFVRDNGAGFDMAFADRLFKPFQRLHDVRAFEGTGIGLATVYRVVARHGGDVRAEGKPDEGACFTFTLPRHPVVDTH